ncbi:hypothetical protein ACB092_05G109100 [Castanea dentata]
MVCCSYFLLVDYGLSVKLQVQQLDCFVKLFLSSTKLLWISIKLQVQKLEVFFRYYEVFLLCTIEKKDDSCI